MATGFGVVRVVNFPTSAWHTAQQTGIEEDDIATTVTPVLDWQHPALLKFAVKHESRIRFEGRYRGAPIDSVVRVYRFEVYVEKGGGTAYACAPKRLWHDAFRRMAKDPRQAFEYETLELNLTELRTRLDMRIGGGWFGRLQIAKVDTAGIFGANVAESDEWEKYEQVGRLNAVIVESSLDDHGCTLMLCQDWTVVVYTDLGEMEQLALLLQTREAVETSLAAPHNEG